jgi:RNA polymerase sigma factor (sigma-70 family)
MTIRIEDHLGLAHLACKPYRNQTGRSFDYQDLFQAACLGLMRSAETYRPEYGKFSTYAVPLAKRYVKRLVATQARTVKVPQYVQDAAGPGKRSTDAPSPKARQRRTSGGAFDWSAPGASALQGNPTREIAGAHPIVTAGAAFSQLPYLGPPAAWARPDSDAVHSPAAEWSFDAPTGDSGEGSLHDVLPDGAGADPESEAAARELSAQNPQLTGRLHWLTPSESFVVRSRLDGTTMPEIAAFMGVSKQRVEQIQISALKKLEKRMKKGKKA